MPAQGYDFGERFVVMLNLALVGQPPSHALFRNQIAFAGSTTDGLNLFASQMGSVRFGSLSGAGAATIVLVNLGLAADTALHADLTRYLGALGKEGWGIAVAQLCMIFSGLENATGEWAKYSTAAATWNGSIAAGIEYSSNPGNGATLSPVAINPAMQVPDANDDGLGIPALLDGSPSDVVLTGVSPYALL